jgi:hypothetical protein
MGRHHTGLVYNEHIRVLPVFQVLFLLGYAFGRHVGGVAAQLNPTPAMNRTGLLPEQDRSHSRCRTNLDAFLVVRRMTDELVDQEGFAGSSRAGQEQIVALLEEGEGMGLVWG